MTGERLGLMFADFGQVVVHDAGPFEDDGAEATFWDEHAEHTVGHSVRWGGRAVAIGMDKDYVDVRLATGPLDGGATELVVPGGVLAVSEILNFPDAPDFTRPVAAGRFRLTYQVMAGLVPDTADLEEPVEQTLLLHLAPLG